MVVHLYGGRNAIFVFKVVLKFALGLGMEGDVFWVSSMLETCEVIVSFNHLIEAGGGIIVDNNYLHLHCVNYFIREDFCDC